MIYFVIFGILLISFFITCYIQKYHKKDNRTLIVINFILFAVEFVILILY